MGTPLSFHRHVRDHGGDDGHGHDGRDDDLHACACEAFQLPQAPMYSHVHAHDHDDGRDDLSHYGRDDRAHDDRDRDRGHDYVNPSHSEFWLPHDPEQTRRETRVPQQ